jgi:hypothetical protein
MKMTAKTRAIRKTVSLVLRFAKSNRHLGFGIAIMLSLTIAAPATAGHVYVCDLRGFVAQIILWDSSHESSVVAGMHE